MKVTVIDSIEYVKPELITGKSTVVIDVLRATSVMITALAHGIREIYPVTHQDEAFRLREMLGHNDCIIAGESGMKKIAGFDYGNSPVVYTCNDFKDKKLIMCTTNGTKAINKCLSANNVYICSLLNCEALAKHLINTIDDITIVCSGTKGLYSLDDSYCAGMLLDCLINQQDIELDDHAYATYKLYQNTQVSELLAHCLSYKKLIELGYTADVEFCLQKNKYPIIGIYQQEFITNLKGENNHV